MSKTITRDILALQRIARELGFSAVAIEPGAHKGFGEHEIVIDWNGEQETFSTADEAEKALREAAE